MNNTFKLKLEKLIQWQKARIKMKWQYTNESELKKTCENYTLKRKIKTWQAHNKITKMKSLILTWEYFNRI